MYLEHSKSQQSVYQSSLLSHLDSSLLNSLCSTFAFLLSLVWLLTAASLSVYAERITALATVFSFSLGWVLVC
jgi:hypothetical protein